MVSTLTLAPHQPRLDWQMWFAALGRYESNPWLVNLVYKLLIGDKEGTYVRFGTPLIHVHSIYTKQHKKYVRVKPEGFLNVAECIPVDT